MTPATSETANVYSGLQLRTLPGVLSVARTFTTPIGDDNYMTGVAADTSGAPPGARGTGYFNFVAPGYFTTLRTPVVAGRDFDDRDTATSPPVAIVKETLARKYFPGVGAVGRRLRIYQRPVPVEVVGVVRDITNVPLGQAVEPAIYFSTRQFPFSEVFIAVKAADAGVAQTAIRNALRTVVPSVPMSTTETWGEKFAARTAEARLLMTILLFFGGLAALLAALGVYGLFSWSVALRTRELAIRLTLGARPFSVGIRVLRQSVVLIAAGLIVGLGIIRLAETALRRVLFEMSPRDPASLIAACVLLGVVALVACVPPALRALRVDPVDGLRAE